MMGAGWGWFGKPIELCLLDLLLCGDNVLVVAIACRSLPSRLRRQAMALGIAGALAARFLLTAMASAALSVPGLKIAGALLLVIIALNLAGQDDRETTPSAAERPAGGTSQNILGAALLIGALDILMSLDNAVALAAVASGNLAWLALGLALCIPPLFFASRVIVAMIETYPAFIVLGAAFLGWVAGDMMVSDAAIQDLVNTQSQALPYVLPPLLALYVVVQTRLTAIQHRRGGDTS